MTNQRCRFLDDTDCNFFFNSQYMLYNVEFTFLNVDSQEIYLPKSIK